MDQLLRPSDGRYQFMGPRILLRPNARQEDQGMGTTVSDPRSEGSRGFHLGGAAGPRHGGWARVEPVSCRWKAGADLRTFLHERLFMPWPAPELPSALWA